MVAPIITFLIAAGLGFLAWKTSTIEPFMEDTPPPTSVRAAAPADEEPADEPAEEEEAPAEEEESGE